MADKKYELEFGLSDGTSKKVQFTAPQGPVGAKGEQGPQGEKGADGAPGPQGATGKSAYEYAKDGGYTGTESEFAAKLAADVVSVTYDADTKTLNISSISGGGDS